MYFMQHFLLYITSCLHYLKKYIILLFPFSQTLTTAIRVYVRMAERVTTVSIATLALVLPATPERTATPVSILVIFPYKFPPSCDVMFLKRNASLYTRLHTYAHQLVWTKKRTLTYKQTNAHEHKYFYCIITVYLHIHIKAHTRVQT